MVRVRPIIAEGDLMIPWHTAVTSSQHLKKGDMDHKAEKNITSWFPTKKNKLSVAEMKRNVNVSTFQDSLKATLIMGQVFSLLPVQGISEAPADVRFVRTSWKCLYSIISFCGQIFITIMCVYKTIYSDSSLKSTTSIIFYATTCITMAMFFHVATLWPRLVQFIDKTEKLDPSFDINLGRRCNLICVIVLTLALFEHVLSLLSAFAGANYCYPDTSLYEGFVRHFYPWVFNFLPYSAPLGIFTQFIHFQSTFIWNFSDLFVICMSKYLTSRLDQVNKKLLAAQGKYLPELFWRSSREEYGRATQLVKKVDEVISGIVFMSFAINLFFICFQLFNTLENGFKGRIQCMQRVAGNIPMKGYIAASYFLFSLVYLISRSVAVSLIAAEVNTASDVPATVLYDVPSPVFCTEVQRFIDQVNGDKVALSGLQFFSVTRGLLLTVAGTIVTYELVMVQFTTPSAQTTQISSTAASLLNSTV